MGDLLGVNSNEEKINVVKPHPRYEELVQIHGEIV